MAVRRVDWRDARPVTVRVDDPEPGPGELLVDVARAGVTLPVVRSGADGPPGGDVAGRVLAVGPDLPGWEPGRRVAGICPAGAYAERAVLPAAFGAPVPDDIGDDDAVALVRGGQVALGALRAAGTGPGDSVLVTAAAGGVGHLAVQLARVLGATRVVAAVGPDGPAERGAMLTDLGATEVRTYPELAGLDPVDVVLDGAGGPAFTAALGVLGPDGRLVTYNAVGGTVDVNELRARAQSVIGFAMARLVARDPDRYRAHREFLWSETRRGALRPVVHGPFALEDAGRAHALLADRANVGRVVLAPLAGPVLVGGS